MNTSTAYRYRWEFSDFIIDQPSDPEKELAYEVTREEGNDPMTKTAKPFILLKEYS